MTRGIIDAADSNEDFNCGQNASKFYEWAKTSMTKHAAGDNLTTIKRIMRCMPSCAPYTDDNVGGTRFEML